MFSKLGNVSEAASQHISMISELSCNTEVLAAVPVTLPWL